MALAESPHSTRSADFSDLGLSHDVKAGIAMSFAPINPFFYFEVEYFCKYNSFINAVLAFISGTQDVCFM